MCLIVRGVGLAAGALGTLERKCGKLDLALEYLNKALELTPRHPPACVEKAIVLLHQGKVNHASKFSDMAVREKTQLDYKRGIERKHANGFVRSSEAQQVLCCTQMRVCNWCCIFKCKFV